MRSDRLPDRSPQSLPPDRVPPTAPAVRGGRRSTPLSLRGESSQSASLNLHLDSKPTPLFNAKDAKVRKPNLKVRYLRSYPVRSALCVEGASGLFSAASVPSVANCPCSFRPCFRAGPTD